MKFLVRWLLCKGVSVCYFTLHACTQTHVVSVAALLYMLPGFVRGVGCARQGE